jgi:hypothetical protein
MMSSFDRFRHLSLLFGMLERVAAVRQAKSIAVKNEAGQVVGLLTLENGLVRFGVEVEGRP